MRLTSKERYAVRAMAWLAAAYGVGPVALAEVAESQRIPFRYLERIAADLRRAGLVLAHRGASGGYELARAPAEITVADVLSALEGSVLPLDCGGNPNCSFSDAADACVVRPLWQTLQRQLQASLSQVTLATMALSLRPSPPAERTLCE